MQQHGETLSPRYRKRFKKYSIMGMSLAEWMRGITGVKLSDNEYKAIGLFSALTALFDDLIDEEGYNSGELKRLCRQELQRNTVWEHLAIHLFRRIGALSPSADLYNDHLDKCIDYQTFSGLQMSGKLDIDTLRDISYGKGGYAVLYYRSILSQPMSELEREVLYNMGAITQYSNDIFDLYFDREEKIQTLATNASDMYWLNTDYRSLVTATNQSFLKLRKQTCAIYQVQFSFHLLIKLTYVALDQLMRLQTKKSPDKAFDMYAHTRQELVCDMDKWSNRFRFGFHVSGLRKWLGNV